jgi:RNA polymerase sporulation-specific sigma factor
MNYDDNSDDELIQMINENHEEAKDILYNKYYYIVEIYVKKYKLMAYSLGIDQKDLTQEAMLGFSDALNCYNESKASSLATFISICVERRIQVELTKASRYKNKMLNDALSLEHFYECFNSTLADFISDDNKNNPLENMTKDEAYTYLVKNINDALSNQEKDVYNLMLNGLNYREIATVLDLNPKTVDNAMQRIKNKVKKIMKERENI